MRGRRSSGRVNPPAGGSGRTGPAPSYDPGMATTAGWQPLRVPPTAKVPAPFARLARAHALLSAGDTLVALALAGSLFFSITPDAARAKVALYLVLTMAPFSVIAPLIGPWIDRKEGGRRSMILLSGGGRAVLCLLMIDDLESVLLTEGALLLAEPGPAAQAVRLATTATTAKCRRVHACHAGR